VGKRRKAREVVLQALYESEFSDKPWAEILDGQTKDRASTRETIEYALALLAKVRETVAEIDEKISSCLNNWELERISLIDKNILRFALTELRFFREVPAKVIIDEAIEIAHKYSSREAGSFVNGVLDRFAHEYRPDEI
jgi:N utilization substance protein B